MRIAGWGVHLGTFAKMAASAQRPVVLVVLDGWGYRPEREGNAVALATTPIWDALWAAPITHVAGGVRSARGTARGPDGKQRGRASEPRRGTRRGAGSRPDRHCDRRSVVFPQWHAASRRARVSGRSGGTLHLVGLLGYGGVHAMDRHLWALLDLADAEQAPHVALHAVLDGRDTPPRSAYGFMQETVAKLRGAGASGECRRPLLRHGPRQPLAANGALLSGGRRWHRPDRSPTHWP